MMYIFEYIVLLCAVFCVHVCSLIVEASGDDGIDNRPNQDKSRKNSLFWVFDLE